MTPGRRFRGLHQALGIEINPGQSQERLQCVRPSSTKPVPQPISQKLSAAGKWRRTAQAMSRRRSANQKWPGSPPATRASSSIATGILMIPANGPSKRTAVAGWISLHQNQLGANLVPLTLLKEGVDEDLRPIKRVAAVIIIAARRDEREIRGFNHRTAILC